MNKKKLVFLWRNLTDDFMGIFPKKYNYDFHTKHTDEFAVEFCGWAAICDDRAIRNFLSRKTPSQSIQKFGFTQTMK